MHALNNLIFRAQKDPEIQAFINESIFFNFKNELSFKY